MAECTNRRQQAADEYFYGLPALTETELIRIKLLLGLS